MTGTVCQEASTKNSEADWPAAAFKGLSANRAGWRRLICREFALPGRRRLLCNRRGEATEPRSGGSIQALESVRVEMARRETVYTPCRMTCRSRSGRYSRPLPRGWN